MLQRCHGRRNILASDCWLLVMIVLCAVCLSTSTVNSKANLENDAHLDTIGLIRKHRYPVEQYTVLTSDGFLLSLVRIPLTRGIPHTFKTKSGPPVLLVHGIISSADDWVLNSPWNSPGFLLSDAGYDVWMLNTRGTPYSKHLKHKRNSREFWDFSFDDIGLFDVPATIDFVLQHTGYSQLTIMGWSQGTTDIMVTLSLKPQYNYKVKLFIALAPVANITHLASPITMLIPFKGFIRKTLELFNGGGVFPSSHFTRAMFNHICNSHIRGLCFLPVSVNVGISPHQLNKTRIPVYMAHMPSGTSTKNLVHFVQNRNRKDFRRYDYGQQENLWRYGAPFPPKYPLCKISAPVAMFWGKGDRLATPEDVSALRHELSHTIIYDYVVPQSDFAHLDFTIGIDANRILHDPVIHVINAFNKGLHLGLYRSELHNTLFESPVPPFPLPPLVHKNPSGLPIMKMKIASIPSNKQWRGQIHNSVEAFMAAPQKPLSVFGGTFQPVAPEQNSLPFAGDTFTSAGDEIRLRIPHTFLFRSHHGFWSSPSSHYVIDSPVLDRQLGSVSTLNNALPDNGLENEFEKPPAPDVLSQRPHPVREVAPQPFALSEHSLQEADQSLSPFKEGNAQENGAYSVKAGENRLKPFKSFSGIASRVNYGLNAKTAVMHPDSNGGFQTDWFPVVGKSKKF